MSHFKRISVFDADEILAKNPSAILIDTREKRFFDENHHPKAIHFDDRVFRKLVKNAPKETDILVYCYHGNMSQEIAQMFCDFGFKSCFSVDGGYEAWKFQPEKSYPLPAEVSAWLERTGIQLDELDARIDDQNRTVLMIAARSGLTQIAKGLVDAGANPNLTDIHGNNALWYACLSQNAECVTALINADVDIDNLNNRGFTALNYVIGLEDIVQILVDCVRSHTLVQFKDRWQKSLRQMSAQNPTPGAYPEDFKGSGLLA